MSMAWICNISKTSVINSNQIQTAYYLQKPGFSIIVHVTNEKSGYTSTQTIYQKTEMEEKAILKRLDEIHHQYAILKYPPLTPEDIQKRQNLMDDTARELKECQDRLCDLNKKKNDPEWKEKEKKILERMKEVQNQRNILEIAILGIEMVTPEYIQKRQNQKDDIARELKECQDRLFELEKKKNDPEWKEKKKTIRDRMRELDKQNDILKYSSFTTELSREDQQKNQNQILDILHELKECQGRLLELEKKKSVDPRWKEIFQKFLSYLSDPNFHSSNNLYDFSELL
jgi:hypothetical protein